MQRTHVSPAHVEVESQSGSSKSGVREGTPYPACGGVSTVHRCTTEALCRIKLQVGLKMRLRRPQGCRGRTSVLRKKLKQHELLQRCEGLKSLSLLVGAEARKLTAEEAVRHKQS